MAADRVREKFDRGAVDEIEYEEITDVFELVQERVRSRSDSAQRIAIATAASMLDISKEPRGPARR